MKISVEEFMKQEQGSGKRSRLEPYKEAIMTLKSNGYSYEQIIKFLLQNDIEISKTALHNFVKSRSADKKATVTHPKLSEKTQSPMKKTTSTDNSRQIRSEPKAETQNIQRPIIGKFDLTSETDVNELM